MAKTLPVARKASWKHWTRKSQNSQNQFSFTSSADGLVQNCTKLFSHKTVAFYVNQSTTSSLFHNFKVFQDTHSKLICICKTITWQLISELGELYNFLSSPVSWRLSPLLNSWQMRWFWACLSMCRTGRCDVWPEQCPTLFYSYLQYCFLAVILMVLFST